MSVREYIGARYVPVFADPIEWDGTSTYEPLTIVQHAGNSYTSRQYVPAGIDIANTAYWALTGNYNAQIEAYRQEVQRFDSRITANANAVDNIESVLPASDFSSAYTIADAIENVTESAVTSEYLSFNANGNSMPNPYLFSCFMSYLNNGARLKYMQNNKTDATATRYRMESGALVPMTLNLSDDQRYFIDCNTLVQLVLAGVPYESSRYAGKAVNNTTMPYNVPLENGNAFALNYYTFQNNAALKELMESDAGVGRWSANQMALYWYRSGELSQIKDYRQLQFGDVVFQQTSPDYGDDLGYWRGITHVGIYFGRSGNTILVGDAHNDENPDYGNGPIFIRKYPLAYFEGSLESANRFTYFYRPAANVPTVPVHAAVPAIIRKDISNINATTRIAVTKADIKANEIAFVNIRCPRADNVYMTVVNTDATNKGVTIRTDLGATSGVIVGQGDIDKLSIYAVPLSGTSGGLFELDNIDIVKYSPSDLESMCTYPMDLSNNIASTEDLQTLFDNIALTAKPGRYALYFDYATSQAISGLATHIGITHIDLCVNSAASYTALAKIQSGTNLYKVHMCRSGSTYGAWTDD